MEFSYDFAFGNSQMQEILPVLGILLVVWLVLFLFAVLSYVLSSIGYHSVAKRRGIRNPWLAWIPVANVWTMGCISDQYQYVVKGKVTNRRKIMLGLVIATYCVSFIASIMSSVLTVSAMSSGGYEYSMAAVTVISTLLTAGLGLTATVFQYMALYDYYSSCCPQNNVLFLVLGIFFSFLTPFFVFFNRKKDGGMPPRRDAQPVQAPVQPEAEAETAAPGAEPWEAPQEADPWDSNNMA